MQTPPGAIMQTFSAICTAGTFIYIVHDERWKNMGFLAIGWFTLLWPFFWGKLGYYKYLKPKLNPSWDNTIRNDTIDSFLSLLSTMVFVCVLLLGKYLILGRVFE